MGLHQSRRFIGGEGTQEDLERMVGFREKDKGRGNRKQRRRNT